MLPWINATALDQRRAFIAAYLASDDSIADLARRFRVSRKTAHKFITATNSSATPASTTSHALLTTTPAPQTPTSPR